jgi:hypothetical protein
VYWDVATMGWGCTGVYERAGRRVVSSWSVSGIGVEVWRATADRASKREREKRGQQPCYQHAIGLLLPSLQTDAAKRATE